MIKVHLVIAVLAVLVTVMAVPRARRQIFGEADPKRVPEMMNNAAFVESQGNCVVAPEEEAAAMCDRIGRRLRTNLPLAIEKGDCPTACNQDEKAAIVFIIKTLRDKYPDIWSSVIDHYNATPEQLTKLDNWVETQSTTTTTTTSTTTTTESNAA